MNWRKLLNHFGFARDVAKPLNPLIERADKVLANDDVRIVVVTKADLLELRRFQATVRRR